MHTPRRGRVLGLAFLLQFITSLSSGTILRQLWFVPGDISATMRQIARAPGPVRVNILVDALTAMGIIFLGVMLFVTLRRENEAVALVGLGLYVLEAALLAASRMATFSLLRLSETYVAAGRPAQLETWGSLVLEAMEFTGGTLHMVVFCTGALLFYALLYASAVIPRALSLWGLLALLPCLFATVAAILGYAVPFLVYVPYVPFEWVVGVWLLVRGARERAR